MKIRSTDLSGEWCYAANIMNAHISKITRESWLIAVYVKWPMYLLFFSGWLYGLYDKQRNPKYKHFTLNIFVFTIFTGQWIYVSWSLECDGHRHLAGLHHFHMAAFVCNPVYIFPSVSQFVFLSVSWIFIWQGRKRWLSLIFNKICISIPCVFKLGVVLEFDIKPC